MVVLVCGSHCGQAAQATVLCLDYMLHDAEVVEAVASQLFPPARTRMEQVKGCDCGPVASGMVMAKDLDHRPGIGTTGRAKELASAPETTVLETRHASASAAGTGTKAMGRLLLSMPDNSLAVQERQLEHSAGSLSVAQETQLESTAHSWKVAMETLPGIDPDSALVALATSICSGHGTV